VNPTLTVTVLSPERKLLEGVEILKAHFRSSEGEIEILPGHISMVGTLETGIFEFAHAKDGASTSGVFSSGFFRLTGSVLTVTAETIELKGEISVDRARAAQAKAVQMLTEASLSDEDFRKYELKLQRAVIRQQVIQ
jgi:F-type H+-transporting ATPase subunit epsilon